MKTFKPPEAIQGIFRLLKIKDGFQDRDFKTPDSSIFSKTGLNTVTTI